MDASEESSETFSLDASSVDTASVDAFSLLASSLEVVTSLDALSDSASVFSIEDASSLLSSSLDTSVVAPSAAVVSVSSLGVSFTYAIFLRRNSSSPTVVSTSATRSI